MFVITVIRYNHEEQRWLEMEYYACKITFELIDLFLLSTLCYIEKGCKWRTNFYAII